MWKKCLECIEELQDILFDNNNIFIGENIAEDSENLGITDQVQYNILTTRCHTSHSLYSQEERTKEATVGCQSFKILPLNIQTSWASLMTRE